MPLQPVPARQNLWADEPHSQEGLREVQERFWLIFNSLPSPWHIYDGDRRFRFVNRSLLKFLGRPTEQVIGHRDEDLLPAMVTNIYLPHLLQAFATRLPQSAECSFSGPLGTFNYITNYVPLLDDAGRIVEVLGISHDNTQQKHFEHELRRRDQELRSLTDNIPDVIGRLIGNCNTCS